MSLSFQRTGRLLFAAFQTVDQRMPHPQRSTPTLRNRRHSWRSRERSPSCAGTRSRQDHGASTSSLSDGSPSHILRHRRSPRLLGIRCIDRRCFRLSMAPTGSERRRGLARTAGERDLLNGGTSTTCSHADSAGAGGPRRTLLDSSPHHRQRRGHLRPRRSRTRGRSPPTHGSKARPPLGRRRQRQDPRGGPCPEDVSLKERGREDRTRPRFLCTEEMISRRGRALNQGSLPRRRMPKGSLGKEDST